MASGGVGGTAGARAGAGLGAALRDVGRSLSFRCLACLAAYALSLFALGSLVGARADAAFEEAFPTMRSVLAHRDALEDDDFGALASGDLSRCMIVIFDAEGRRLFASSDRAAESVRASDLPAIDDYDDPTHYEVFEERGDWGVRYRVLLCSDAGGDVRSVLGWGLLDEGLRVLDGDLFAGRAALSEREFGFIEGRYGPRMSVSRLEYATEGRDPRTLVLFAPLIDEAGIDEVTARVGRMWVLAAPVALALTVAAAFALRWQVRRAARPLDAAIGAYRSGLAGGREGIAPATEAGVATELVPIYENFSDLMARLRGAQEEGQRMVADLSHDLKTPLTVIRGYAQAFCDGKVPAGREGAYHAAMRDKAIAASELLDALCEYARTEHPEYRARLVRADVGALVVEVAGEARPQAERSSCTLEALDETGGAAEALVDAQLFRRMLLNLLDNAFSHNPAGTRVLVRCSAARGGGSGGVVSIAVCDDGVELPPQVTGRVFEPFVTGNVARTPGRGTGLGLAMVRRAASLMGGAVEVDPCPGGSWTKTFVVTLPLADPQENLSL